MQVPEFVPTSRPIIASLVFWCVPARDMPSNPCANHLGRQASPQIPLQGCWAQHHDSYRYHDQAFSHPIHVAAALGMDPEECQLAGFWRSWATPLYEQPCHMRQSPQTVASRARPRGMSFSSKAPDSSQPESIGLVLTDTIHGPIHESSSHNRFSARPTDSPELNSSR